jgi:hypothetical protein
MAAATPTSNWLNRNVMGLAVNRFLSDFGHEAGHLGRSQEGSPARDSGCRNGVLVSAGLGKGLKGANYVLRRPLKPSGSWFARMFTPGPVGYSLRLAPRDEAGAKAMSELRARGLGLAADALAKSAEHILSFFRMLQTELAFYIGCVNLHERVLAIGARFRFPPRRRYSLTACRALIFTTSLSPSA